jgi:protein SDA1
LDEHFAALRKEANGGVSDDDVDMEEEDDEAGWDNWDVESDSGSSSSSGGWEDVSSDGDDLEISDSDDEAPKKKAVKSKLKRVAEEDEDADEDEDVDMDAKSVVSAAPSAATEVSQTTKKLSLLAQQKILTPADFALLNELRLKAAQDLAANGGGSAAKRKLAALEASKRHVGNDEADRFLTESEILGPRKKAKADYEERRESIRKGREGREKFGSLKGKKMKENKSSSTNREKARNKPIMMALQ